MNNPVKFELAKLLKEKGFDLKPNRHLVRKTSTIGYGEKFIIDRWLDYDDLYLEYVEKHIPIIAEVVMWLYEKHGIWISAIPNSSSGHQLLMRKMSVHLFKYRNGLNVQTETLKNTNKEIVYFLSPTKAYEAAIEYILNNLI